MKKSRTIWTTERIDTLKRRYSLASSLAELAKDLGCTVNALYGKAFQFGLKRQSVAFRLHKYTAEQFEFIRRHYPDMSNKTLSVVSGVTVNAIRKWRWKFGWLKSERYRLECKEYTCRHRQPSERRRILQREYARRYREKHPERVAESRRKCRENKA